MVISSKLSIWCNAGRTTCFLFVYFDYDDAFKLHTKSNKKSKRKKWTREERGHTNNKAGNDALHCIEWIEEFKKSMYNIKEDRDKEMNNKEKILLFEGYITWAIFFRCSFVFFPKNTHTR